MLDSVMKDRLLLAIKEKKPLTHKDVEKISSSLPVIDSYYITTDEYIRNTGDIFEIDDNGSKIFFALHIGHSESPIFDGEYERQIPLRVELREKVITEWTEIDV